MNLKGVELRNYISKETCCRVKYVTTSSTQFLASPTCVSVSAYPLDILTSLYNKAKLNSNCNTTMDSGNDKVLRCLSQPVL